MPRPGVLLSKEAATHAVNTAMLLAAAAVVASGQFSRAIKGGPLSVPSLALGWGSCRAAGHGLAASGHLAERASDPEGGGAP